MPDFIPPALKGQLGVNAVEHIFLREFGWIFRRQLEADFGIDAQVEVMDGDHATGRLFALQIKSGPSYFQKNGGTSSTGGRTVTWTIGPSTRYQST